MRADLVPVDGAAVLAEPLEAGSAGDSSAVYGSHVFLLGVRQAFLSDNKYNAMNGFIYISLIEV